MKQATSWWLMPPPIPEFEISEEYQCDVLIVGASFAGAMALEAALDAGVEAIALEKKTQKKFHVNGAEVGHINSEYLKKQGVPGVDPIDLFNEWLRRAGNRVNQSLVMQFCKECGPAFDYFVSVFSEAEMEEVRVKYWPLPEHFTGTMNGYRFWPGTALFPGVFLKGNTTLTECVRRHHQRAEERGGQVFYGTEALYPIMDGDRVAGIVARTADGQCVRYLARKGVILAAGDFGGNEEMCRDLLCDTVDLMDEGDRFFALGMGDGLGIRMGVWAGGCLENRPVAAMGGNSLCAKGLTDGFSCLWLDYKGERFCNEMFSGDSVITGIACNQEKHGPKYSLFDANIAAHLQYGTPSHASFDTSDPEALRLLAAQLETIRSAGATGSSAFRGLPGAVAYCGETWPELADRLGLERDVKINFLASVDRYNALCRRGRDEDFGKDPQLMIPLDQGPFYAVKIPRTVPGTCLVTVGGLLTDRNQQVLNKAKDPIPGLSATGNCCGRRFGTQYATPISGVSIGMALTLGYAVGRHVAGQKDSIMT